MQDISPIFGQGSTLQFPVLHHCTFRFPPHTRRLARGILGALGICHGYIHRSNGPTRKTWSCPPSKTPRAVECRLTREDHIADPRAPAMVAPMSTFIGLMAAFKTVAALTKLSLLSNSCWSTKISASSDE